MAIRVGIEEGAENHKIQLLKFLKNDYKSIPNNIDGIIIVGNILGKQLAKLKNISKNIVLIDSDHGTDGCDAVFTDFESVTKQILVFFVKQGHQHIGYLGGYEDFQGAISPIQEKREIFFRKYMTDHDLLDERYIYTGAFTVNDGYTLMKQAISELKDDLPSAFFVGSDPMAIGALRALHEENIAIPDRVSIIGVDDISVSKYVYPPLSTVRIETELTGETAVDLIMERLTTERIVAKNVYIETSLKMRDTTKER